MERLAFTMVEGLAFTGMFVVLGVVVIGAGIYIWTNDRQKPGLVLRLLSLALIELTDILILVAFQQHPLFLFLSLIPTSALIPVVLSLLVVSIRTRK